MKKIKKIVVSLMAVAAMATSMVGINAYAIHQVVGSYGTFQWDPGYAKTINNTNKTRILTASVLVYQDLTGNYVTAEYATNTGGNNQYAKVDVSSQYTSNSYNFTCSGNIYNSNISISGVAESWTKYVN